MRLKSQVGLTTEDKNHEKTIDPKHPVSGVAFGDDAKYHFSLVHGQ